MELGKLILVLLALFISSHAIFLRGISSASSERDTQPENPQRNLEANGANMIIFYLNQNCHYSNGLKNDYRKDISFMIQGYGIVIYDISEEMTLNKDVAIEIHFDKHIKTFEHFFDAKYDKNMKFDEFIDFSYFDSSEVEKMSYMFAGCETLKSIKFGNFQTNKVPSMDYVFFDCLQLTSLNLSSFNTEKVKNTSHMFINCISLAYLDISNFNLLNVDNDDEMAPNLFKLNFINLSNYQDKGGVDGFKIETMLEFRNGLNVCKSDLTQRKNYFIYCCDYSKEANLCLEKKIILQYIITILLTIQQVLIIVIEMESIKCIVNIIILQ